LIGVHPVTANIEEYITMISAGLIGATPHMISATITAISRLLFEFKGAGDGTRFVSLFMLIWKGALDNLPPTMQSELLATIIVFLRSANREIVKSALGFVKLATITLPISIVRPQFPDLVPALLGWSHDHKNHFKTKVQHIFERMGRRFGWDDVLQSAGDSNVDGLKVLENVKKRKEKAKKKKAANREEEQEEEGGSDVRHNVSLACSGHLVSYCLFLVQDDVAPKPTTGDAFEDVLYGSDSDVENGSDGGGEDEPRAKPTRGRPVAGRGDPKGKQNKQTKRTDTRIRVDNDEPMDLLHGGAANTASELT
jgi:ribosomal RNA-processing protein 12